MKEEVRKHIHNKVRHPFFLPHLLVNVRNKSHESHSNYIEVIEGLAVAIRGNLEALNLIKKTDTNNQKNFWQKFKGEKLFGFIDGGSTDINIPSAAPMGIRVACYLVSPGRRGKDREDFDYVIQMVDELYDSVYFDDFSPNISQMKDSSRIMCETAGCVNVLENVKEIDSIFLHGPLVNPVSPYGASQSSIPPYSKEAITKFMPHLDPENLSPHNLAKEEERRHFIPIYLEALNFIKGHEKSVYGIVERSMGGSVGHVPCANVRRGAKSHYYFATLYFFLSPYEHGCLSPYEHALSPYEECTGMYGYYNTVIIIIPQDSQYGIHNTNTYSPAIAIGYMK